MAQETKECPHEFEYLSERSKDEDIPEQSWLALKSYMHAKNKE
jgi:hypothetical protein